MPTSATTSDAPTSPSPSLMEALAAELVRYAPFSQMESASVEAFVARSRQAYFAPGERILAPADGPFDVLHFIRRGSVTERWGEGEAIEHEAGDLFPLGPALERPVESTFTASEDCFCLLLAAEEVRQLATQSPPFASFLAAARRARPRVVATALADGERVAHPLRAGAGTAARLAATQASGGRGRRDSAAAGTGDDDRSACRIGARPRRRRPRRRDPHPARRPRPRDAARRRADDAGARRHVDARADDERRRHGATTPSLAMARHGIRHLPVTETRPRRRHRVSERDLFALQRLSLKGVERRDPRAPTTSPRCARRRRRSASSSRSLLAQGVGARQLTELISHLNDVLTERLVRLMATRHGLDLHRACWLAFGSEGRSEQTIATDQDNGHRLRERRPGARPPRLAALRARRQPGARRLRLPAVPRQRHGVEPGVLPHASASGASASRPGSTMARRRICSTPASSSTFARSPDAPSWSSRCARRCSGRAGRVPRFLRQMAENALQLQPPLNWLGGIETRTVDGRETIDIKLQGTALFVDVARIYALAHGCAETGTRELRCRDRRAARRTGARGRRLGRGVRVPADAAPAGADRDASDAAAAKERCATRT